MKGAKNGNIFCQVVVIMYIIKGLICSKIFDKIIMETSFQSIFFESKIVS